MLNLFASANFNNLFKMLYVSLSVPGSQKSDKELEKTTELKQRICVLFSLTQKLCYLESTNQNAQLQTAKN